MRVMRRMREELMRPVYRARARSAPGRVPYGPPLSVTATEGGSGEMTEGRPQSSADLGRHAGEDDHATARRLSQRRSHAPRPRAARATDADGSERARPRLRPSPIRTVTVGSGLAPESATRTWAARGLGASVGRLARHTAGRESHPAPKVNLFIQLTYCLWRDDRRITTGARRSRATAPPHCNHTARSPDSPRACRTSGAPSLRRRSGRWRSA